MTEGEFSCGNRRATGTSGELVTPEPGTTTPESSASAVEKLSPLDAVHRAAGASFTDFAGWQMPVRYSSDLAEHHAVRTAAGLFDLSHMGEILSLIHI